MQEALKVKILVQAMSEQMDALNNQNWEIADKSHDKNGLGCR